MHGLGRRGPQDNKVVSQTAICDALCNAPYTLLLPPTMPWHASMTGRQRGRVQNLPEGPFRTKNARVLKSAVFHYCSSLLVKKKPPSAHKNKIGTSPPTTALLFY